MSAHLQKKRKYGAVVSIITTATWSSISVEQDKRSTGMTIIRQHENRNMTLDGAVLCKCTTTTTLVQYSGTEILEL